MPRHLKAEGKAEWKRITSELESMGILGTVDRAALTLYIHSWQIWIESADKVNTLGVIVAAPKTKVPMQNPYLSIANKAHEQIAKLLVEFGLTPSSRTRMKLEKETKIDLASLIGGA